MITTELYVGQGLGNQLWSIAACQSFAHHAGVDFAILGSQRFKGHAFMKVDFGTKLSGSLHDGPSSELPTGVDNYFVEDKLISPELGLETTRFDRKAFELQPATKIDGCFQSERYVRAVKDSIVEQFQSKNDLAMDENTCVISFRGGEYRGIKKVLLTEEYYRNSMDVMRGIIPNVNFLVITDDAKFAKKYFPSTPIISSRLVPHLAHFRFSPTSSQIGRDFTWIQRARYIILSNSSFSWWGAWTNVLHPVVIGPKYWAAHNVSEREWSMGDSLTENWLWLDRHGKLWTYEDCLLELNKKM